MSDQIPTHYAVEYASTIGLLLQQKGSRLRDTVSQMSITGAKSASIIDQIGKVEATKRTTRYPSLSPADTPTDRPWVYPSDYDWNDLIDSIDKLRVISDPQSSYALNGTYAMGRAIDRAIIAAFFADMKTGEAGGTTVVFPAADQVAVNFGAAGNVGMTVAKLKEAKRLLMAHDIDVETEQIFAAVTAKQHDNLLGEIQVISTDFNEKPVLVDGLVTRFLGINIKHTELMANDATPYRRIPVYIKSGVMLATWNDISTDISIRKDLAGLPVQVYVYATFGATRTEAGKVIEVKCNEA